MGSQRNDKPKKPHAYKRITFCDRITIKRSLDEGQSIKEIANKIGVHVSTLYRELKKGGVQDRTDNFSNFNPYMADLKTKRKKASDHIQDPPIIATNLIGLINKSVPAYVTCKVTSHGYQQVFDLNEPEHYKNKYVIRHGVKQIKPIIENQNPKIEIVVQ